MQGYRTAFLDSSIYCEGKKYLAKIIEVPCQGDMHEGAEIEVDFGSIEYRRVAGNQAFISQCANPGPAGCG